MHSLNNQLQHYFNLVYQQAGCNARAIMDALDGPVLVNAVPGLPINQVIAARIAHILLQNNATPVRILCLTTTVTAAQNLQSLLHQSLGTGSEKVAVYTISAFCNKIITDHANLCGLQPPLQVTTMENIALLKKLVDHFPNHHPLKKFRADVYQDIPFLKRLFSYLKKNNTNPANLSSKTDQHIGGLNIAATEIVPGQYPSLQAGINEYPRYLQLLEEGNRYDAADCIVLANKALHENPQLTQGYHRQFQYVQVDAFNGLRVEELSLLQALLQHQEVHKNILVIDYPQQLKPAANNAGQALFNYQQLAPVVLNAEPPLPKPGSEPVVQWYPTMKEEMIAISNRLQELLQQQVPPADIAVIYPSPGYQLEIQSCLKVNGIACNSRYEINLLANPFSRQLIKLLRYLNKENEAPFSGDGLLFEILHASFFNIPPIEIATMVVTARRKKYNNTAMGIRRLLKQSAHAPARDLFDTGLHPQLKQAVLFIESCIAAAAQSTLPGLFETIIASPLMKAYLSSSTNEDGYMQTMEALHHLIKVECSRQPSLQLNEFIELAGIMEKEGIALPAVITTGTEKDVQLITAAEAAGRNFKYLLISGSGQFSKAREDWFTNLLLQQGLPVDNDKEAGIDNDNIIPCIIQNALINNPEGIFITCSTYDDNGRCIAPAGFVAGYTGNNPIHVAATPVPVTVNESSHQESVTMDRPKITPPGEAIVKPVLDKFVMSVSALNTYLRCPLAFYYHYLLRVPDEGNEAMAFGSAIHYALEQLFKQITDTSLPPGALVQSLPGMQLLLPEKMLVEAFNSYMYQHQYCFDKPAFKRRLAYGERVLLNYYHQYHQQWNMVVSIERNIRGVMINGIPIKGKPDKLEFNGREVTIVDYKSGDFHKAVPKMQPPHSENPDGGDYWRQAVFYTLLVNHYPQKQWRAIATEFDFIEPGNDHQFKKEKIMVQPADATTVVQQITQSWNRIQSRDFYTGCGRPGCHWCNFVKDHQPRIAK